MLFALFVFHKYIECHMHTLRFNILIFQLNEGV